MGASLLAVLVVSVLLAAVARHYDVSAPLALVVAGLLAGLIPGFKQIELDPELVLYVLLPPLLWSAGLESSYHGLRRNIRKPKCTSLTRFSINMGGLLRSRSLTNEGNFRGLQLHLANQMQVR